MLSDSVSDQLIFLNSPSIQLTETHANSEGYSISESPSLPSIEKKARLTLKIVNLRKFVFCKNFYFQNGMHSQHKYLPDLISLIHKA